MSAKRGDTGLDTGDCYTINSRSIKDGLLDVFTFRPLPVLATLTRFIADAMGRTGMQILRIKAPGFNRHKVINNLKSDALRGEGQLEGCNLTHALSGMFHMCIYLMVAMLSAVLV